MRLAAIAGGLASALIVGAQPAVAQRAAPVADRMLQVSFAFDGHEWTTQSFVERTRATSVLLVHGGTLRLAAYAAAVAVTADISVEAARDWDLAARLEAKGDHGLVTVDESEALYLDPADAIVIAIRREGAFEDKAVQDAFIAAAIAEAKKPQMLK
jgi:hypothetical protein